MRPITVSVGPLAAANATCIAAAQSPASGGCFGTQPASVAGATTLTTAWNGTASFAAGVMTVLTTISGAMAAGMSLTGVSMPPGVVVLGPIPGVANAWRVSQPFSLSVRGVLGNPVYAFDNPRQVAIATTEPAGKVFTVSGFDAAGTAITEQLPTTGAALLTNQSFAAVTSVSISAPGTVNTALGTASSASSPWVMFDPWAAGNVSKQCVVSGAANFTVQVSNDDPNSPLNPVPAGLMTWSNDPDATFVNVGGNVFGNWAFMPVYARVLLNSGAGSVAATFLQTGAP